LGPTDPVRAAELQGYPDFRRTYVAAGESGYASTTEAREPLRPTVTLTPEVLRRHNLKQHILHRDTEHLRVTQTHHAQLLRLAAEDLGIDGSIQHPITQSSAGMSPYERFKASSDGPLVAVCHQQNFTAANESSPASYQSSASPITSQYLSNRRDSDIVSYDQNSAPRYLSSQAASREASTPGPYELTGIGTQFEDVAQSSDVVTPYMDGNGTL